MRISEKSGCECSNQIILLVNDGRNSCFGHLNSGLHKLWVLDPPNYSSNVSLGKEGSEQVKSTNSLKDRPWASSPSFMNTSNALGYVELVSANPFNEMKVNCFGICLLLFLGQAVEDDVTCYTLNLWDIYYTNPVIFILLILEVILRLSTKPALVSFGNEPARVAWGEASWCHAWCADDCVYLSHRTGSL